MGTLLPGIPLTLEVTFAAFGVGAVLGLPLMLARRSRLRVVRGVAIALIDLLRAIPELVWIFLVFYGLAEVGPKFGAVASAVLALGVFSSAYMAEIYRSGLVAIHRGQWEASQSLGLSRAYTFIRIISPQAILVAFPSALTFLINLVKDSSLASVIGVSEIVYRANQVATTTDNGLTIYIWAGLIYLIISVVAAMAIKRLERRLRVVSGL